MDVEFDLDHSILVVPLRAYSGNNVTNKVVEDPHVIKFFNCELYNSGLVGGEIFVKDLHC